MNWKVDVLLEKKYKPEKSKVATSHKFFPGLIDISGLLLKSEENNLIENGLKISVPPRNIKRSLDQLTANLVII